MVSVKDQYRIAYIKSIHSPSTTMYLKFISKKWNTQLKNALQKHSGFRIEKKKDWGPTEDSVEFKMASNLRKSIIYWNCTTKVFALRQHSHLVCNDKDVNFQLDNFFSSSSHCLDEEIDDSKQQNGEEKTSTCDYKITIPLLSSYLWNKLVVWEDLNYSIFPSFSHKYNTQ